MAGLAGYLGQLIQKITTVHDTSDASDRLMNALAAAERSAAEKSVPVGTSPESDLAKHQFRSGYNPRP